MAQILRPNSKAASSSGIDMYTMIPLIACVFALILSPLLISIAPPTSLVAFEPRVESRIFWPVFTAISLLMLMQRPSKLWRLSRIPNILFLVIYIAFAAASVLWAFKPEIAFTRVLQQLMIIVTVVGPAMLASGRQDVVHGLFLCFSFACMLSLAFILGGSPPTIVSYGSLGMINIGYPGYFPGKNYLGECAAAALLISLYEIRYHGARRVMAIVTIAAAIVLIQLSKSKTAIGLALLAPAVALSALYVAKTFRVSLVVPFLCVSALYLLLSSVSNLSIYRISYMLYGDSCLTGRCVIWDFLFSEIDKRPLLGWGYLSFWLVGPDAPSIVDARGWVKGMPNAHNGYYDTMVELGYVGYSLLLMFILATIHVIGRTSARDLSRAWVLLSLALYVIMFNVLESIWARGFEFLWIVFLIVTAEAARCYQAELDFAFSRRRIRFSRRRPQLNTPQPVELERPIEPAR